MSCEHARDCQRDNQVECTHEAIAKLMKRERPRVSVGICEGCAFNTEKGKWPILPPPSPPTAPQQRLVPLQVKREPKDSAVVALQQVFRGTPADDVVLIGTKLEAWFKETPIERSAKIWEAKTGIPCGCSWRRDQLNAVHQAGLAILARLRGKPAGATAPG